MIVDVTLPPMGESLTQATILKWHLSPGDRAEKDRPLLDISTEKVDSEVPSPVSGILIEILFNAGAEVSLKQVIARIDTEAAAATAERKVKTKDEPSYSPLAKAIADKHGLQPEDLSSITERTSSAKVTKQDVLRFINGKKALEQEQPAAASSPIQPIQAQGIDWGTDDVQVIPMDSIREAIAEHMVRSKRTSPHVYSVQEVDMTVALEWRSGNKALFHEKEGFKLSVTPCFLEAAVEALLAFPYLNASVEGKNVILKRRINLGCAVALGTSGLIVPVIKRADEKNIVGLARSLHDLSERARNRKLLPDDVAGGTFTVTNPGGVGTLIGTPIINQPQVAILGIGAIQKRPVVIDDMIAIREMCYLTLSYDHRVIDGALAGNFLNAVKQHLETWNPERSLY